jgi:hypothetical protein
MMNKYSLILQAETGVSRVESRVSGILSNRRWDNFSDQFALPKTGAFSQILARLLAARQTHTAARHATHEEANVDC